MTTPSTINTLQDEIIEEFSYLDDWMDKYQMIIDMGADLPELPEADKTPDHLIAGCQSRVWVTATVEADRTMTLRASSDAVIVKGIIALLIKILNHQPIEAIAAADLYFIEKIGLREHLSPTRSNGLLSMVHTIQAHARHALEP